MRYIRTRRDPVKVPSRLPYKHPQRPIHRHVREGIKDTLHKPCRHVIQTQEVLNENFSLETICDIKENIYEYSIEWKILKHVKACNNGSKTCTTEKVCMGRLQKHSFAIVCRNQWLNWFP